MRGAAPLLILMITRSMAKAQGALISSDLRPPCKPIEYQRRQKPREATLPKRGTKRKAKRSTRSTPEAVEGDAIDPSQRKIITAECNLNHRELGSLEDSSCALASVDKLLSSCLNLVLLLFSSETASRLSCVARAFRLISPLRTGDFFCDFLPYWGSAKHYEFLQFLGKLLGQFVVARGVGGGDSFFIVNLFGADFSA